MDLLRYASPDRWRRFLATQVDQLRRRRADDALDAVWRDIGPLAVDARAPTVIADGLWFNPGYFLRLRLFLEAWRARRPFRLLGLLRADDDGRARRALARIGFGEFVAIDAPDASAAADVDRRAGELLATVRTHRDLATLALPFDLPAHVVYDTVLKKTRHARPPLDHPEWRRSLAEALALIATYDRLLASRPVDAVVLSHGWKNEWAVIAWLALKRGIPVYLVTAFSEAIRIRRCRAPEDLDTPVEHLPRATFDRLPAAERAALAAHGARQLARRQASQTSDVNIRHAYVPEDRTTDRAAARAVLGAADERPVGVIYGHSWFDFPHVYGMANFTDFLDWFEATLAFVREHDHVTWLLKPHPMESWYGGYTMRDAVTTLPPHVRLLDRHVDTLTVMSGADAIVTVHGTAGLEAAAAGVPVIAADRSYYAGWGFVHPAGDRAAYGDLLGRVGTLARPDAAARALAHACFACAYAEPEPDLAMLRVPCDSLGAELFDRIGELVTASPDLLRGERDRIGAFLDQDEVDSFTAFTLLGAARAAPADAAA